MGLIQPQHITAGQTDCTISIVGHRAYIDGRFPLAVVRKATSYYVDGFIYSKAYKRRVWDGKKHLFDQVSNSMPAGLVPLVIEELKVYDPQGSVRLVDDSAANCPPIGNKGFSLLGIEFGKGVFDYQLAAAKAMVEGKKGILRIATNGGKTEVACAVTKHIALPTLFLVDRVVLVYQTVSRFAKRLGMREEDIGFVGDGEYRLGKWITVATPASLTNRLDLPDVKKLLSTIQVVISDECHHVAGDTHYDVLSHVHAYFRFGLSGTPLDRSDGADLRLLAQTGPVLYDVSNKLLVERGISVPPSVEMVKIHTPIIPHKGALTYRDVETLGIVTNNHLNTKAATLAIQHARNGEQVVMLVDKKAQGKALSLLLEKHSDKPWAYLTGSEKGEKRLKVLQQFTECQVNILVATPILDEGVDIPNIDVLILCAGGKAKIRLLQRVGRGLRTNTGKKRLLVYDFANFCHKWLLRHSLERLKTYKDEACFLITSSS